MTNATLIGTGVFTESLVRWMDWDFPATVLETDVLATPQDHHLLKALIEGIVPSDHQ